VRAWIVVDLGFGDAGKGSVVDFLVRNTGARLVVRFNGGAQAGHNVVCADGRHHTFSQLGAGSFVPGVRTLLGPDFLLHPGGLLVEAAAFGQDALSRLMVDAQARVITPYQQAAGRARERGRGARAHGTCGVGVGECVRDALAGHPDTIRATELRSPRTVLEKLTSQRERKRRELDFSEGQGQGEGAAGEGAAGEGAVFALPVDRVARDLLDLGRRLRVVPDSREIVARYRRVVFEGAQGVLLDEDWGFHPHTTWSDCTFRKALALLDGREAFRLGLTRSYAVRHGPGPFPTAGSVHIPEPHNGDLGWQGTFRTGLLDTVLLRYAARVLGGLDGVGLTWLDTDPGRACVAYRDGPRTVSDLDPGPPGDLAHRQRLGARLAGVEPIVEAVDTRAAVATALGVPVVLESHGPRAGDKRWMGLGL